MAARGVVLWRIDQLDTCSHADFLDMLEHDRLKTENLSKLKSLPSQLDVQLAAENMHIGALDPVPLPEDNQVCFRRMEREGFG